MATIAGIPVRLHATFLAFLLWLGAVNGATGLLLVVGLFVCVVLHEYGHALTARRYGVATRDITLYPIGGVAMLAGRLRPREELWVALAGPAVNLVLALFLAATMRFLGQPPAAPTFLGALLAANVVMAAFNLIPAFPMDGGRVLRALLARWTTEAHATAYAAKVGQIIAAVMIFFGVLHGPPLLALVGVFVFLGAGGESRAEAIRAALRGHRAGEAMQTRFRTLSHGMRLGSVSVDTQTGVQRDYPVVSDEAVLGLLTREDLARGLAEEGPDAYVAGRMHRDLTTASPNASLEEVAEILTRDNTSSVLVVENGRLVGMVSGESVGEFLMRQQVHIL